jgi:hypothetical protein
VSSIFAPGESTEEKSAAVIRSRRNLLLATVALFLAEVYGITVQSGQLFGLSVRFIDQIDVAGPLWLVAFYFLLRFAQSLQSFVELGVEKNFRQRFLGVETLRAGRKKAERTLDGANHFDRGAPYERYEFPPTGSVETKDKGIEVRLSVNGIGPGQRMGSTGAVILVTHRELLIPKVRAWVYVMFATPIGTDLFLPPALLIAVLGMKVAGAFC